MRARILMMFVVSAMLCTVAVNAAETAPSPLPSPAPESPAPPVPPGPPAPPDSLPVPLDQPGVVSMAIKDANALVVIETIVINGRYNFAAQGHVAETVSINFREISIAQALDAVVTGTGLEYRVNDNIVVLYGRDANPTYVETYHLQHAKVDEPGGAYDTIKSMMRVPLTPPAPAATPVADDRAEFVVAARERNRLIVKTRPSVHRAIAALLVELDSPLEEKPARDRR